ncbi:hypothetical protein ACJDU8_21120 [Clostridium sp. WILCCON 0269]|uniref:Uncharacterized protein n=1 Tax=Candidatus Clostridium eludens TaxID=3381663 RepID=A0ABW8SQ43_9CLOT
MYTLVYVLYRVYDLIETMIELVIVFFLMKWILKVAIEDIKESSAGTIYLMKMIHKNSKKDFIKFKNELYSAYKNYRLYREKKNQERKRKEGNNRNE